MNTKAISPASLEKLQLWSPKLSSVILVLLIAYALVQILWLFMGNTPQPTDAEPINAAKPAQKRNVAAAAQSIAKLHLFGKADALPAKQLISAPETKLNLQLKGILAIGEEDGMAIISAGSSKEDVYTVGERIPGNATLKAVYADRVLLESSRGLETLRLPKMEDLISFSTKNNDSSARGRATANTAANNNAPPISLKEYRRQLVRNPASLAEIARVSPETVNGEFKGYRITPQQDNPMFDQLGLESGDVITDVNGISMDRPEDGLKALRQLMKAKQLDVTVLRDGQETNIQHQLD